MPTPSHPPGRRAALSLSLIAASLLALPIPAAAADPQSTTTAATPLGATVQFRGWGYGHGVGLSQHGARGRALGGQTAATILAHYYQGTTLGTIDPSVPIRVLLLHGYVATDAAPLVIVGQGGAWTATGVKGWIPGGAALAIRPPLPGSTMWRMTIIAASGAVLGGGGSSGPITVAPVQPTTFLELKQKSANANRFRGSLVVHPNGTASLSVVNHVGLDSYLRGVVPLEMPASWPAEALKAQAIAARSYAAYRLKTTGTFDAYDDTRSQVYRGILGEQAATDQAITATAGQVLRSNGALVNAVFHSTGGCGTEHNENAFVSSTGVRVASPVAYLRGVSDRRSDGTCWDADSPYLSWRTATYSLATLSSFFAADERTNVGNLVALDLSVRGVSGRLLRVTLVGDAGSKTVSADVFRAVFHKWSPLPDPAMRSNAFVLVPQP